MNYQYAKFHAFIRKWTIDVIFHWLYRILCVLSRHPYGFLSIEHRSPPVYQDPTCTANFLYRYTSLISAASWYTGGTMFYKKNSFLVDYIVKKWHFCPKISKIRQYTEEICLKPIPTNYTNKKYTIFPMFVCWNFCPYWADFLPYHNISFVL